VWSGGDTPREALTGASPYLHRLGIVTQPGSSSDWDSRLRRSKTPAWLDTFCRTLYGGICIRCGTTRPLEVAHLDNWSTVRDGLVDDTPAWFTLSDAKWFFHQPSNVVLLCANCHTLYDQPVYTDVTREHIIEARNRVLSTERAALVVREYVCRGWRGGVGSTRQANVINRWAPLLQWLEVQHARGLVPPPHRFLISEVEMIDLNSSTIMIGSADVDRDLPRWRGKGFQVPHLRRGALGDARRFKTTPTGGEAANR
jgi:HNH endonuclease